MPITLINYLSTLYINIVYRSLVKKNYSQLSSECKQLLHELIEPNPTERITSEQVSNCI